MRKNCRVPWITVLALLLLGFLLAACELPFGKKEPPPPPSRLQVGVVLEVRGKSYLTTTREDLDTLVSNFRDDAFVARMKAERRVMDLADGSKLKILEKEDVLGGIRVEVVSGNLRRGTRGYVSVFVFTDFR
jgi:hypothetical protein